jgi:hypothetical protein
MDIANEGLSPRRRARLAQKGRVLYRKSCNPSGKKTCAEGFALHHIGRGEVEVVRDLLAFLEAEAEVLRRNDPELRLAQTKNLIDRVRHHLALFGDVRSSPSPPAPDSPETESET